jgi:hypothetical protein
MTSVSAQLTSCSSDPNSKSGENGSPKTARLAATISRW